MGFSSYLCAKSGSSIPACPWARADIKESQVIVVLPNDETYEFIWDGYQLNSSYRSIDETGKKLPKNFDSLWSLYDKFKKDYLDYDYNKFKWPKRITKDGKQWIIDQFNWGEPLKEFEGLSLNQLRDHGYQVSHANDVMETLIKIVKKYNYNGEKFADLKTSEYCPYQGFFYPNDIDFKADLRGVE